MLPEDVLFELGVRSARKLRKALVPSTFVDREDQVDVAVLAGQRLF